MFLLRFFLLLICLLIWASGSVKAQYNQYRVYTSNDGLTYSETLTIYTAKDGSLWTQGTSGDFCRFDGRTFNCQLLSDLGMSGYVKNIFEDESRLWVQTQENNPIYMEKGRWHHPNSDTTILGIGLHDRWGVIGLDIQGHILQFAADSNHWQRISSVQIDMECTFEFSGIQIGDHLLHPVIQTTTSRRERHLWALKDMSSGSLDSLPNVRANKVTYWDKYSLIYWQQDKFVKLLPNGTKSSIKIDPSLRVVRAHFIDGTLFIGAHKLNSNGDKVDFQLFQMKEGRPERVLRVPIRSRISTVEKDLQGHFWLTCHEGLIRCNPNVVSFHQSQPNMISALHAFAEDEQGRMWFGGYGDGLCYYDGNQLQRPGLEFQPLKRILPGSYRDIDDKIYFWEEFQGLIQIHQSKWKRCPQPPYSNGRRIPGYFMRDLGEDMVGLGLSKVGLGLARLPLNQDGDWKLIGEDKGLELTNVLTLAEDRKGRLWCGRPSAGIALYDPKLDTARTWKNSDYAKSPFKISSSIIDERGHLWLGCHDGLKLIRNPDQIELNDSILHNRVEKIDLGKIKNDKVNGLLIYEDYLIIGGQNGHAFMDLNSFYTQEKPDLFFFDTSDPAQGGAGEQNALYTDSKGYLWIGKDRGALRVDMENLVLDTMPVSIVIDEITAGNEEVALRDGDLLELPTKKRSLQLNVHQSFSGYLNDNVDFRYRINKRNEEEGDFLDVPESGSIRIDYLAPGSYTLDFKAIKNNQISDIRTLSLEVPFLLVEMPLFWIGLIGFFFLAVFIILYFQYQSKYRIKQSELQLSQLEGELDQMQVKAISSALNPHFINNALHWLQSKMRSDKEAVQMIDRISENIRMVFTRSRQGTPFHTLKEELNLVQNYVHVQQIRYGNELKCDIPSPNALNQLASIQIPLMQIQIHMENAIEHGTRNRMGKGWVKLSIDEEANHLHIKIADNGIGREKAREIGSGGTQQGVTMLKNLHRIYNQKNKNKIEFWYDDLPFVDEKTGEKVGTIAHIQIPKDFHYALTST